MTTTQRVKTNERLMGRLSHDADLLKELTAVCCQHEIRLGRVEAIGALKEAVLSFYDQQARTYRTFDIKETLEITSLIGNISLKDDVPIVHAHITLSNASGEAFGGHLAPGCKVFACEFNIEIFKGDDLVRGYDEETGLPLWQMDG
jgi:predicted DNA-binding protein with PD1-like motif